MLNLHTLGHPFPSAGHTYWCFAVGMPQHVVSILKDDLLSNIFPLHFCKVHLVLFQNEEVVHYMED